MSVGPGGVQANGDSARLVISAGGNLVAFESAATNLGRAGHPRPLVRHEHGPTCRTSARMSLEAAVEEAEALWRRRQGLLAG
jgi:hypothetical protein